MKPKKTRATLTGKKFCAWEFNEDDGTHETQCGQTHYFPEGGIADNRYVFCPYCGRRIDEMHDQEN
jgi:DNA-directed RNA polymerase subunit RPC12/RpoP